MKILIENGSPHLQNMGDVAMLQVAVLRLKEVFPNSVIRVITDVEDRKLAWFCDDVIATKINFSSNRLLEKVSEVIVGHRYLFNSEVREYVEWADLVVTAGGGYLGVNAFMDNSMKILDTIYLAKKLGKKVAVLGHGFSISNNEKFIEKMRDVLAEVDYIFLRESSTSLRVLGQLGIVSEKVVITGDDAIQLAYSNRAETRGDNIGINLRFSSYTNINSSGVIGTVLGDLRGGLGCQIVNVPISLVAHESDVSSAKDLPVDIDGSQVETPKDVIRMIGQCRVVITSSYHAGVFALSQGIPVIGLAASDYYREKFRGLANQFGNEGCWILDLHKTTNVYRELFQLVLAAWDFDGGEKLLSYAKYQIRTGQEAYNLLARREKEYRCLEQ